MTIDLSAYRNIVVLTGAGISVASGLRPFRGPGGLWTEEGVDQTPATPKGFAADPRATWRLFSPLREAASNAQPNTAHHALRAAEAVAPGAFVLITQNVDGLHQRAGSQNVVEVHGNVFRTKCGDETCTLPRFVDESTPDAEIPTCPTCGGPLRPDVVLFEEPIDVDDERLIKRALRDADLFIAIGTSGTVSPASNYVRGAAYAGARTILVNLEAMEPKNPSFSEEYLGKAEDLLPQLLGV